MKPLPESDFRARRYLLEKKDFAVAPGEYKGPTDLIDEDTWRSIVTLPDDVSIRTSDKYGPQLAQMWTFWGMWPRIVGGVQALSKDPKESPTAIAACDATDEFQAATYAALVGYYRVAFSCLRNVVEQITIATQLALSASVDDFKAWRAGEERIKFGWAADLLPKNPDVGALEKHLEATAGDSLFAQKPNAGWVRRFFAQLSKYTHGAPGFADGDFRESNGPLFLPKTFLDWCVAAMKTYAIALHELKLAHPKLEKLPWGPPPLTVDEFRRRVVATIPTCDKKEEGFFQSLVGFWR
jgi:hypothetical protein